jgi:AraC family transcriptional regulator, positive regulator of tynA and feaB
MKPLCSAARANLLAHESEVAMLQNNDYLGAEQMDYGAWSALLRSLCGRHNLVDVDPHSFSGWLRALNVCGFTAVDISCSVHRFERTHRDVRLDDFDYYKAVFQLAGHSTIYQNDQCVRLAVGDVALVDTARPITCVSDDPRVQRLSLHLPRRSLISHLGFEPRGGACIHGGPPAGRLLYEVVHDALNRVGPASPPVDSYMQLAVYNLLGALFAPPDPPPCSPHAHKLFMRIRHLIEDRVTDPDFGPMEAASEAGISLRYLQKLFTQRGLTCTAFIYSVRLNRAARLLDRRSLLSTREPISTIAYDCGFRDYTHFARKFRHRFGYSPGAHSPEQSLVGHNLVRTNPVDSTQQAHDAWGALI